MTYQQLIQLPFYRAAYCMTNLSGDPLEAYSQIYMADYYVTEQQAYESTRDAVWSVLKSAGMKDNDNEVINNSLTDKLISADKTTPILTEEPSADKVSVTGDPTFYYSNDDQKWHTDRLSLSAPSKKNQTKIRSGPAKVFHLFPTRNLRLMFPLNCLPPCRGWIRILRFTLLTAA